MAGHPTSPPAGLLLTADATTLLGIITAEALYTAPYTTRMEISDLGATDSGVVLHPSSSIFNATMLVTGVMILLGAYFTHQALHRRAVTIPTDVLGVGVFGVGSSRATPTQPCLVSGTSVTVRCTAPGGSRAAAPWVRFAR